MIMWPWLRVNGEVLEGKFVFFGSEQEHEIENIAFAFILITFVPE